MSFPKSNRIRYEMICTASITFKIGICGPPSKGQLISKGLFDVIVSTKKNNEFFVRISALASKKRWDQKIKALYITN